MNIMAPRLGSRISRKQTNDQRFWSKVEKAKYRNLHVGTPCWEWTASVNKKGYGRFAIQEWQGKSGVQIPAHHYLWCNDHGPVGAGMHLDHLCRNKKCVRPDHLERVTAGENALRRLADHGNPNTIKTHCIRGHKFTSENTRIKRRANGSTYRNCRQCARDDAARRRAA